MSNSTADQARATVGHLIEELQDVRRALRAIEESEHPAITDALGRVWMWRDRDLYTHDGMSWPREYVTAQRIGLPTPSALDNPNYQWCGICKGDPA